MELGNLLLNQLDLRKEAEPFLKTSQKEQKDGSYGPLSIQTEVVYIDKVETDQHTSGLRMASRVGLGILLIVLPLGRFY